jgi:predicted DNA-binding transcriptional regulator YafY
MSADTAMIDALAEAIKRARVVRLVYRRQSDEVVSIHEIAPIDLRPGWTRKTASILYLWAWCFAEGKLEMHLMERVQRVIETGRTFDPALILSNWPEESWPLPETWEIQRQW